MRNRLSGDGNLSATQVSSSYLAAVGLFTLQNLRSLLIDYKRDDADFYKGICEAASQSKIEELKHVDDRPFDYVRLGPVASSHYARAICSMPNLRSLELNDLDLSDEYYSTMAAEASTSKIEELKHIHHRTFFRLGPEAFSHYARAICSMPNLRSLELNNVYLSDEYYSTMASEASTSMIEVLKHVHDDVCLGYVASSHYARGICSMPNLRSLELKNVHLSDEYYSIMAAEASTSMIEVLKHKCEGYVQTRLGPAASSHYAKYICSMPNLRSLELNNVQLSDEYYSTMAAEASTLKIQTLSIANTKVTRHSLHAILSLPCLQSLSLARFCYVLIYEDDVDESMPIPQSRLVELTMNAENVPMLWKLRLHTSCSLVKKLSLHYNYWSMQTEVAVSIVDVDIVSMACSPFTQLTLLHIIEEEGPTRLDPVSFCNAVKTSCPQLIELSIDRFELGNNQATEIIQSMKTHPQLTRLLMKRCYTDNDLDPLIAQMNSEGKLTVTVEHYRWLDEY